MSSMSAPVARSRAILNARKQQVTREAILEAAAAAICAQGIDFSIQEVADRAGVTHRTVYRYFESREALLDAARTLQDERLHEEGATMPSQVEEVPAAVERLFRGFDRMPELTKAAALIALTHQEKAIWRNERTHQLRQLFEAAFPNLGPAEVFQTFAVMRTLAGSVGWYLLSTEFSLSGAQSGPAIRHVLELLIADLQRRDQAAAQAKLANAE